MRVLEPEKDASKEGGADGGAEGEGGGQKDSETSSKGGTPTKGKGRRELGFSKDDVVVAEGGARWVPKEGDVVKFDAVRIRTTKQVTYPTLESSWGQILSQYLTDATSSRWHLCGS